MVPCIVQLLQAEPYPSSAALDLAPLLAPILHSELHQAVLAQHLDSPRVISSRQ